LRAGIRPRGLAVLFAGTAFLGPGPLLAQAPGQIPRVTGSVELALVNVDVVVTWKDGKPVEGLTPADFTVLHAKKPVSITNFREEKPVPSAESAPGPEPSREGTEPGPAPAPAPAGLPEEGRVRRHIAIFVDNLALPDPKEREEVFGSIRWS